jgi:hypothetical protein
LKSVSICAALILAAAVFADSAEARQGFGGGRGMSGFSGARMGGMSGFSGARMSGFSGGRFAGPGRMGITGARFAGPGRMGIAGNRFAGPVGMGPGRVAWAGRGNWSGNRWAGNWRGGHWRGGRWWPWWGVGAGVALAAATWPYYGGYDSCVQWLPDYGWVNVCGYPYGGYGYY